MIDSANLGEAYENHEVLRHKKTALTAVSGENVIEAEKRATDLIRQKALKSAV